MIENIRKLVGLDKIEEALQFLKNNCDNTNFINEIVLIESRYNNLTKSQSKGILFFQEATVTRNQITNSILEVANKMNTSSKNEKPRSYSIKKSQEDIVINFNNNEDIHKLRDAVSILRSEGRLDDAAKLLSDSLKEFINRLGPIHPTVANCRQDLGIVFIDLGIKTGYKELFESARDLFRASLDTIQLHFNEKYNSLLPNAYNNLATAYYHLGHEEEARRLYSMAYEISVKVFSDDHWYSYMARESIKHIDEKLTKNNDTSPNTA